MEGSSIGELYEAKCKLSALLQDSEIQKNYQVLAELAHETIFSIERQIMSLKPKGRNKLYAKNKHKQAGD